MSYDPQQDGPLLDSLKEIEERERKEEELSKKSTEKLVGQILKEVEQGKITLE